MIGSLYDPKGGQFLRSVTDEIMYALMDLGGQEYVDMYATRAKQIEADQGREDSKETKDEE